MYDNIIKNNRQPGIAMPKLIYHALVASYISKVYKHNSKSFFEGNFKIIAKTYFVQAQEQKKSIDFMGSKLSKMKAKYFFYSNKSKLIEMVI